MQKEKKPLNEGWTWVFGDAPGDMKLMMMMTTQAFST
jgi:hypothetical protein